MKLVELWDNDKCRYCSKTKADSIHILYCTDQLMLETKYELITDVHTQMNKVEGDSSILNNLYLVITNELLNKVPPNLHSVTSDLL